ncbi:V-type ATP synthase subunit C [Peptoniphilus sp. GNH]|nr:ATP synthase, subunit C [Clostridiales bacterium KA00134]UHR03539.1 V-type ATP synthase subunit C [Peptoniphilus sp. GNH]
MDRNDYIQSSATVRVLEKKLLDKPFYNRLIESRDLAEAIRFLQDSYYQTFVQKLSRPEDYELALKEAQDAIYKEAYGLSPHKDPVEIAALIYNYHNLKVLAKEIILKKTLDSVYVAIGDVNIPKLREAVVDKKPSQDVEKYYEILQDALSLYEKTKDPQAIDIFMDKKYFENLKYLARKSEMPMIESYAMNLIDFTNIKTFLRCKKQERSWEFISKVLIEGGFIEVENFRKYMIEKLDKDSALFKQAEIYGAVKAGLSSYEDSKSLSLFEQSMDNYFVNMLKEAKKVTYGPEVIFAYVMAKENEIKNIRIILMSKLSGLDSEKIRQRLRDSYV